jgi:hypothetical protein
MTSGFSKLTQQQRKQLLIHLFQKWLVKVNPGLDAKFVPQNFPPTCCQGYVCTSCWSKD